MLDTEIGVWKMTHQIEGVLATPSRVYPISIYCGGNGSAQGTAAGPDQVFKGFFTHARECNKFFNVMTSGLSDRAGGVRERGAGHGRSRNQGFEGEAAWFHTEI